MNNLVFFSPLFLSFLSGYYAFIEASSLVSGDFARLESGALRSTQGQPYCFSFWYHMYGPSIGTFRVIQRDPDGQNEVIVSKKQILFPVFRQICNEEILQLPLLSVNFLYQQNSDLWPCTIFQPSSEHIQSTNGRESERERRRGGGRTQKKWKMGEQNW